MIGNGERAVERVSPERDASPNCKNCGTLWAYHPVIPGTSDFYCHIVPMEKVRR